ncbi:MAG: hypothetical protein WD432_03615 [Candidatus Saccharimonadales bacterium]
MTAKKLAHGILKRSNMLATQQAFAEIAAGELVPASMSSADDRAVRQSYGWDTNTDGWNENVSEWSITGGNSNARTGAGSLYISTNNTGGWHGNPWYGSTGQTYRSLGNVWEELEVLELSMWSQRDGQYHYAAPGVSFGSTNSGSNDTIPIVSRSNGSSGTPTFHGSSTEWYETVTRVLIPRGYGSSNKYLHIDKYLHSSNNHNFYVDDYTVTPIAPWESDENAEGIAFSTAQAQSGDGSIEFAATASGLLRLRYFDQLSQSGVYTNFDEGDRRNIWKFAMTAGLTYNLQAVLRAGTAGRSARLGVRYYDSQGDEAGDIFGPWGTLSSGAWTTVGWHLEAPEGAVAALPLLEISSADAAEVFHLDDFTFDLSLGWEPDANTTLAKAADPAGAYEVTTLQLTSVGAGDLQADTPADGGDYRQSAAAEATYLASARMLAEATSRDAHLELLFYDQSGAVIGNAQVGESVTLPANGNVSTAGDYALALVAATAPAGTYTISTRIVVEGAIGANEVFHAARNRLDEVAVPAPGAEVSTLLKQLSVTGLRSGNLFVHVVPEGEQPGDEHLLINGISLAGSELLHLDLSLVCEGTDHVLISTGRRNEAVGHLSGVEVL